MQEISPQQNIRNFCIIAHIDHGKSTLADRFLELTSTVEKRKMREQYLDMMELERERGITIKMQPVRMLYKEFILNLIDTPGHIDFSYEVSRSLKAVEGAILLVDATQGVQAQTVSSLELARFLGMVIVPVVNKIDSPYARVEETKKEIVEILGCDKDEILEISAKTGEGVADLLEQIIKRIPSPHAPHEVGLRVATRSPTSCGLRALVFDFEYSLHKGIVLYVRVFDGVIAKGDNVFLYQANINFSAGEVGIFAPSLCSVGALKSGEIGYVVTNVKKADVVHVGDTLLSQNSHMSPLKGYKQASSVVWASVYPESQDDFLSLKQSLQRLKLSDSALHFEEEKSGMLGRGFRCGFLGMLHLEIVAERLRREFGLKLITAMPSVVYKVEKNNGENKEIYSPALFPEHFEIKRIFEPWVEIKIIAPFEKLSEIIQLLKKHDADMDSTEGFGQSRLLIPAQASLSDEKRNSRICFFEL
jgi:GTP-binding protein LepA